MIYSKLLKKLETQIESEERVVCSGCNEKADNLPADE